MKSPGNFRDGLIAVQNNIIYAAVFVILAVVSALLLLIEFFVPNLSQETVSRIQTTDLVIAYIFLGDFFTGIALAYNRKTYFKDNWLNFASSIPVPEETFRALRLLRAIRAARTIRIARGIRVAANTKQAIDRERRLKNRTDHRVGKQN